MVRCSDQDHVASVLEGLRIIALMNCDLDELQIHLEADRLGLRLDSLHDSRHMRDILRACDGGDRRFDRLPRLLTLPPVTTGRHRVSYINTFKSGFQPSVVGGDQRRG